MAVGAVRRAAGVRVRRSWSEAHAGAARRREACARSWPAAAGACLGSTRRRAVASFYCFVSKQNVKNVFDFFKTKREKHFCSYFHKTNVKNVKKKKHFLYQYKM